MAKEAKAKNPRFMNLLLLKAGCPKSKGFV
jgi:hypothetical protein